ncbi:unnamed protein product [Mucor hiemalis]
MAFKCNQEPVVIMCDLTMMDSDYEENCSVIDLTSDSSYMDVDDQEYHCQEEFEEEEGVYYYDDQAPSSFEVFKDEDGNFFEEENDYFDTKGEDFWFDDEFSIPATTSTPNHGNDDLDLVDLTLVDKENVPLLSFPK